MAWCSSDDAHSLSPSNYSIYIDILSENRQIELLKPRCPSLYLDIRRLRRKQPSVLALLNLAALQGVSVLDILLRPKESASKPLFDRFSDFEGVPFPPVAIDDASRRVNGVVQALLGLDKIVLPPLHLLCTREQVQPHVYSRFHESYSIQYRARFAAQQGYKRFGGLALQRAFLSAIHMAETRPEESIAALSERLKEVSNIPPAQLLGIAGAAVEIAARR